jgi:transcriptional regulator with XRE-family HTH domain
MKNDDEELEAFPLKEDEYSFADWLRDKMAEKNISIPRLSEMSGITYVGIWNIVEGNTRSPRDETRKKLAKALQSKIPKAVEDVSETESKTIPGYEWSDFTPSDLETVPEESGVYVFYDITDRPVYVGKSTKNVRLRVKDHMSRFWFKEPLVVRGAFLNVPDSDTCNKIEMILIKFLGKHALLNTKGAVRDFED